MPEEFKFYPFWSEKCPKTLVFWCLLALSRCKRARFEFLLLSYMIYIYGQTITLERSSNIDQGTEILEINVDGPQRS